MFCKVIFLKTPANVYSGRKYTYETDLPLSVGDHVSTPPVNEGGSNGRAIVVETDCGTPDFPCRKITEYDYEK